VVLDCLLNANRGTVRGQIDEHKHIRANPQHSALGFDRLTSISAPP